LSFWPGICETGLDDDATTAFFQAHQSFERVLKIQPVKRRRACHLIRLAFCASDARTHASVSCEVLKEDAGNADLSRFPVVFPLAISTA
jgi:hypothetical protein